MEQPIYEEMNPVGTDGVADAEQPIYEEMKPVASEGSEPVKEAAVEEEEKEEEEEWEDYVQNLEEYLEDEGLYSTLIVALIEICHKPLLSYCQDSDSENDNEEDSGAGTECETSGDSGVDTEPDAAGGVKEQPPYRAQTPEPEEADPTKDEEEKCPCVQALYPDVWDGPVDFTHLASRIIEKINPDCCYRCGLIELAHKLRDGEFGADPGLPKVTLIEIEGKDLCEFLQGKLMNCTEKQNRCRERDDEKQEKMV
ncbi:UNVERIFIED_CONTAM: hypothetical protein K2H54_009924 [Gekko kuhli]